MSPYKTAIKKIFNVYDVNNVLISLPYLNKDDYYNLIINTYYKQYDIDDIILVRDILFNPNIEDKFNLLYSDLFQLNIIYDQEGVKEYIKINNLYKNKHYIINNNVYYFNGASILKKNILEGHQHINILYSINQVLCILYSCYLKNIKLIPINFQE